MLLLLGNSLAPTLRDAFKAAVHHNAGLALLPASIGKFVSSEAFSEIKSAPEAIKGQPVTIVQSLAAVGDHSANDLAMELLLTVRTLKNAGAGPIWVVMPFAAFSRQDRAMGGRLTSVGIDDFSFLLKQAGAAGVSTIEMHSAAGVALMEKHFGAGQVYNLDPTDMFTADIRKNLKAQTLAVGGPDAGANARADAVAHSISAPRFAFEKQHTGVNETEVKGFSGNVGGAATITVDDMIDTGGTVENSQISLAAKGAISRHVYASHGVLSKGGLERLFTAKTADGSQYAITTLVLADTIDIGEKLAALRRQYGDQDVDARVRLVSAGDLLTRHILSDIIPHPAMQPTSP